MVCPLDARISVRHRATLASSVSTRRGSAAIDETFKPRST
jgi:hypothetical protein